MSDINTYADETAIAGLGSAINGDLVLNQADSSLYLCTNADVTGIARWKKFANNSSAAPPLINQYVISLNGSSSVLAVGDITDINSATNMSVSGWYNPTSFPNATYNSLWGGGGYGDVNHPHRLWLSCNGTKFTAVFGTGTIYNFNYTITIGQWYHVVFTVDGPTAKLYVNGEQVGSTITNAPSLSAQAGNDFEFGGNPTYRPYLWSGLIDEAAIFASTLSEADIIAIYKDRVPSYLSDFNPVAWYRMGDDSNDSPVDGGLVSGIQDSSGNGNHATTFANSQPTFSISVPS